MSILIGLPCMGGNISESTTVGLFNLAKDFLINDIDHGILTLSNSSIITKARSNIANFFINRTSFDYLFFLDSDIGFKSKDVLQLLSHKVDIVSATYPMKVIPKQYCVDIVKPEERNGNLVKINGNGMGFTLIHRKVFLDIANKYPGLKYTQSNQSLGVDDKEQIEDSFHYFVEQKVNGTFWGEDKSFFYRASKVGYDIWMDSSIRLNHTGYHIYEG